ncbi:hypothetical protein N9A28_03055 [Sulfurimonas sp.]|nr:hypothetical protein [Sulfurimonas sp.]
MDDCPIDLDEVELSLEVLTADELRRIKRDKGSDINPAEVELFLMKAFGIDFDELRSIVNERRANASSK